MVRSTVALLRRAVAGVEEERDCYGVPATKRKVGIVSVGDSASATEEKGGKGVVAMLNPSRWPAEIRGPVRAAGARSPSPLQGGERGVDGEQMMKGSRPERVWLIT